MNKTFKKIIGLLHLWLGLASGLIVFVVSLTGNIFVFEEELDEYFNPELYKVGAVRKHLMLSDQNF
ncbi:PepSY domain-containing protein [Flavobacterium ustbae]|uniref:PepSY domain-containing protein n=1 Tax=Flavobacterium ustbae TaxID=2488790 RepID=UPI001F3B30ED|nr:PepSY-associated TM helix domain-containing protein [Flavobacterium ustbae]